MKLIKEKKINNYLMIGLVYLSFCACFYFSARGTLAFTGMSMAGAGMVPFMFNGVVAFIIGGIVPTLLYEIINSFVFKMAEARLGASGTDMRYALRFFYIPANIVCFGLKLLFFITPLASIYGNIIIDFVITGIAVTLFLVYASKNFVDKTRLGALIYQVGGAFLIVHAFLTVLNLIMGAL